MSRYFHLTHFGDRIYTAGNIGRIATSFSTAIRRFAALLGLFLMVAGCSRKEAKSQENQAALPIDVAPGNLLIDLLESGRPETYWQYQLCPSKGKVSLFKEEHFPDSNYENIPEKFQEPTGAIQACAMKPEAASPNGNLLAFCDNTRGGQEGDHLWIAKADTKQRVVAWTPGQRRKIMGFSWSPNSGSVAILNSSSRYGKNPIELLSSSAGHPVPHDTVFLDILDTRTGSATEYLVRRDVTYAFARILEWSN